jgi:hypothetical protein
MSAFSYPSQFAVDVRNATPSADGRKLWARDPSLPGANDGARIDHGFADSVVANLRALAAAAGTPQTWNDDTTLSQAVQALTIATLAADFYTAAQMDSLFVPKARTLTGAGLVAAIGDLTADRSIDVPIASQAEAEAGLINNKAMTPLRTAQAIEALFEPGVGSGVTGSELAGALYPNINVASAGACDILGAASIAVSITGNVTITSLGTGTNRWRIVTFTGAPLLTHNATSLILPTGANIQAAANDCMIVRADGSSNARVVDYIRANGQPLALSSGLVTAALGFTPVTNARTVSASGLLTGGGDLTANRTLTAPAASQAEAQAGSDNTKVMTPLRVAEAIAALSVASFNGRTGAVTLLSSDVTTALGFTPATNARTLTAAGLLTGGGDLTANRTFDLPAASQAEAEAGSDATKAMTPQRMAQAIAALAPVRSVQNVQGADLASNELAEVSLSIQAGGVLRLTYRTASGGGGDGGDGG